jgi:branched-chain amino acid transport system ATP-binding protein
MLLEVRNIDTCYGIFQAIFGVSLALKKGEVVSLLGRNGAGKTTTLASIMGLQRPRSGSILFKGEEILGKKTHQIARLGIGFIPEDRWIFSELTVRENLELGLRKNDKSRMRTSLERVYSLFPKLKDLEDRTGGTLSGGEQQMLTIGRTLMGTPEVILLDEPTAGLSPLISQLLADQIGKLQEDGYTVLLTEQNALLALRISQRACVIDKGIIVFSGAVADLKANQEMMRKYLGV